jgi:hypothetical protein
MSQRGSHSRRAGRRCAAGNFYRNFCRDLCVFPRRLVMADQPMRGMPLARQDRKRWKERVPMKE